MSLTMSNIKNIISFNIEFIPSTHTTTPFKPLWDVTPTLWKMYHGCQKNRTEINRQNLNRNNRQQQTTDTTLVTNSCSCKDCLSSAKPLWLDKIIRLFRKYHWLNNRRQKIFFDTPCISALKQCCVRTCGRVKHTSIRCLFSCNVFLVQLGKKTRRRNSTNYNELDRVICFSFPCVIPNSNTCS